MINSDNERTFLPPDFDEATDISESLSVPNNQKNKSDVSSVTNKNSLKKFPIMNNLKMTRNDVDPNQDEEEVSLIQENEPVTTFTNEDEEEEEGFVEPIEDDVEVIQADESDPDAENEALSPETHPPHLASGPLSKLSSLGNPDTPFPDNSDNDVSLIQENEPITTFNNEEEEEEEEAIVEPVEDDVEVMQADEIDPDAESEALSTQTPRPYLGSGSLPKLSNSDNLDTPFPDNSDNISFNIADEQTEEETMDDEPFKPGPLRASKGPMEGPHAMPIPTIESPGVDDDEDDDDDDDVQAPLPEGSYDPSEYEHLDVPPELKELFSYISNYTPQNIELEHKLRPYIPDYIPAVGDIDAFIKIPRPDDEASTIGLTVLDEPSAKQSDSTVLDLQLRAVARHTTARAVVVKTVENAEKNSKVIEKWMRDISDLHRAKPPPTVHYSKQMPDIDSLMQEWPGEIEELVKEINLPSAALQVELPQYVDLICSILDIPVYKSRIQSLHVFFTLFSSFKNSANFRHLADENLMENEPSNGEAERLVLN